MFKGFYQEACPVCKKAVIFPLYDDQETEVLCLGCGNRIGVKPAS